jgi:hypothetical protein
LKIHIQDKLAEEIQNYMTRINQALKICWNIVNKSRNVDIENGNGQTMAMADNKTVLQASHSSTIPNGIDHEGCVDYCC